MNNFKEWLSDNLRYLLLAVIIVLIIVAAILGITIYSKTVKDNDKKENATEAVTQPVKDTETQMSESRQTETVKTTERESQSEEKKGATESQTEAQTESSSQETTEASTQPQTEYVQETDPPEPVYMNLQGSCYLRSAPSYEGEIIGEYGTGTTVQFLEDVGGWYKVSVDGMTGYMGARFF